MKYVLALLLLVPISIKAWTDEVHSDKKILDKEERYLWYKENIINEEYLIFGESEKLVDLDTFIYSEFSEYSDTYPEEINERVIENSQKEVVLTDDDINGAYLKNFSLDDSLKINDITVFYKGIEMRYQGMNYEIYIDGNLVDDFSLLTVKKDTEIYFEFDRNINYNDIIIKLFYSLDQNINFSHVYTNNKKYEIAVKNVGASEIMPCEECGQMLVIGMPWSWKVTHLFYEPIYRYKDKLYLHYEIEKEYVASYHKEMDGYIKDESSKKMFYLYEEIKETPEYNSEAENKTESSTNKKKPKEEDKKQVVEEKEEVKNNNLINYDNEIPEIYDIKLEKIEVGKNIVENKFPIKRFLNIIIFLMIITLGFVIYFVRKSRLKY